MTENISSSKFVLTSELKRSAENYFSACEAANEAVEASFRKVVLPFLKEFFANEWDFNDRYIYLTFERGNNGRMYSRLSPYCEGRLLQLKTKMFLTIANDENEGGKKTKDYLRKYWLDAIKLYTISVLNGRLLDSKAIYNGEEKVVMGWNKAYIFPPIKKAAYTLDDMEEEFLNNFHDDSRTGVPGFPSVVRIPFELGEDDAFFNAFPRGVPGFALLTFEEKAGMQRELENKGDYEEDKKKLKEYEIVNGIFKSSQPPDIVRGKTKDEWNEEENIFREYCFRAHPLMCGFRIHRDAPLRVGVTR